MTISVTSRPAAAHEPLDVCRIPFAEIPRAVWDRLYASTPAATPFSGWTFHRAWWDGYGPAAEELYLVVSSGALAWDDPDSVLGIAPLMVRDERTVFMAASYHADYATLLASASALPRVTEALAEHLMRDEPVPGSEPWAAIDLRRLRHDDPALLLLEAALREVGRRRPWTVRVEVEDVSPVVRLPADREALLARLDGKVRHEIRRKLRRADRAGSIQLRYVPLERASADAFIAIHQARWGDEGLFPDTADGERTRTFLYRLVELEAAEGTAARLHLAEVLLDERVIYGIIGFADGETCYFYNAGMDPGAAALSPGVVGTTLYLDDRMSRGDRRFDFLRGDESYKYAWGAVDETILRLLVERSA